jgi:hypothetical protein
MVKRKTANEIITIKKRPPGLNPDGPFGFTDIVVTKNIN